MKIYGIDFTSRPTRSKPITCLECRLYGSRLEANELFEWSSFDAFDNVLRSSGPWIAGIDFPFGLSRRFVENIGWPNTWPGYVDYVGSIERKEFRKLLDDYRAIRPKGDKEHRRATDIKAGSISPQKLYGIPVGMMFFEGAPRLRKSGVTIPGLQQGDPQKIVVEAYPGVLARTLIGRRGYKQDTKSMQTQDQYAARRDLLEKITENNGVLASHGLTVAAPGTLVDDPGADHLDALLCAIQAGWSWMQKNADYGAPRPSDPLEGWIADPVVCKAM